MNQYTGCRERKDREDRKGLIAVGFFALFAAFAFVFGRNFNLGE